MHKDNRHSVRDKVKICNGETMLIMVKDGAVIHFTPDMAGPTPSS